MTKSKEPANESQGKTPRRKVTPKAKSTSAPKTKPKATRKPIYDKADYMPEILARIAKGEPLRQICREEGKPSWGTVYAWLDDDKELAERFARARELGEEAIAQECLDIADNGKNDWMEANGQDAVGYKLNGEHVQRSKLRIETRLKLLAKWNPKKWGEKVDLNHGVQPENPLATLIQRVAGTGLPIVKDDDEK